MSINWVMLHESDGFVRLPNERVIYTSPPRTSISLQPVNTPSGSEKFSRGSSSGRVRLTNQRIVYLPAESTSQFQSFAAPLLNLRDTHVSAPFFGPNVWTAQVQPIPGGGFPASNIAILLKMTFKDGGAFDFHTNFEQIKERLQQAIETAEDTGTANATNGMGGVNYTTVHLEELPVYEGPGSGVTVPAEADSGVSRAAFSGVPAPSQSPGGGTGAPCEPPPGYEEAQQQGVANDLEDRIRRSQ